MSNQLNKSKKPFIEIIGVDKFFGEQHILKNCSLNVFEKETVVIIGPSGSGKSTLLRTINQLEPADAGDIFFEGKNITHTPHAEHLIRRDIGMVFQSFDLFPHLTAAENIMLAPMKVRGISRQQARQEANQLLKKVHLENRADHFPDELSGGQQQRIAIARALAMKPKVMLYDEPTSALDPEMIREVLDVITELSDEGMTSIVVTHEMGFARHAADRIVFMENGEIVEDANGEDFFGGKVNPRAGEFISNILH